jgi:hypothetical protein
VAGLAIPRALAEQERESRRGVQENTKRGTGEVSGCYADASVVKFAIEDWINSRTLGLAVPRDKASHLGFGDTLAKVHDGAVVKADLPSAPGSSGTGEFSLIWYADGNPGPGNDGSPEMMRSDSGNPGYFGFRRWAERLFAEQDLEEAKHTGHLRLDDGEVDAWHCRCCSRSVLHLPSPARPAVSRYVPSGLLAARPRILSLIGETRLAVSSMAAQDFTVALLTILAMALGVITSLGAGRILMSRFGWW